MGQGRAWVEDNHVEEAAGVVYLCLPWWVVSCLAFWLKFTFIAVSQGGSDG
jgi:hypothetical protein